MSIKRPYLINQARGLEKDHKLVPQFAFSSTHKHHMCMLIHTQTGELVHTGTSVQGEEDAFHNAIKTIDIKALTSSSQELSSENQDLHSRIADLESQLEDPSSTGNAGEVSNASSASEGDSNASPETKVKKTKKKAARKKAALDLPSDTGVGITRM